jgi:arsenical pump membrane protein
MEFNLTQDRNPYSTPARYHRAMNEAASTLILLVTLTLVLFRPRGLPAALPAAAGGCLVLALRLVSVHEAWDILRLAQDALVFLVGMMLVSAIAERAGFFEWSATLAARAGRGSVLRLYLFIFLIGALITATLSLDATAIVLTPIVYAMALRLKLKPLPFMFACSFIANTASLFMPISNLTNLLIYRSLDFSFIQFSLIMLIPAVLAVVTNAALFSYLFRRDLRGHYSLHAEPFRPANRSFFILSIVGLATILVAIFAASVVQIPIGLVALVGGVVLLAISRIRGWMPVRDTVRAVSWNLIVLVLGLFLVVQAVENAGLSGVFEHALRSLAPGDSLLQLLGIAVGTTIGANLINNIPMTIVAGSALRPALEIGTLHPAAGYAALLGTNIGPNLTITGSLATLIWLSIVQGRGLPITSRQYLRLGIVTMPLILLSAVLGLWLSVRLF